MSDEGLVGRCGIYCGACTIYRAYQDGGDLRTEVAEHFHLDPVAVVCEGCNGPADRRWGNCKKCELARCMQDRGIRFCHQCPGFDNKDCEKYQWLEGITSQRGEDIRAAELRFREGEAGPWLEEQRQRWRCLECGQARSWYDERCRRCGSLFHQG